MTVEHWRETQLLAMMYVSGQWDLVIRWWPVKPDSETSMTILVAIAAWQIDYGLIPQRKNKPNLAECNARTQRGGVFSGGKG